VWISSLVALTAAFCLLSPVSPASRLTPLAALVLVFAVWMVITNQWANPSYTAAAPYHAAFLLGGFFLGRRAGTENADRLFHAALAFSICLAGWAIWQRMQGEARAHALFETPATLSSTINLVLLPGLVLALSGKRGFPFVAAIVLLIAAAIAATSRGGWLGLAIGGVLAYQLARRAEIATRPNAVPRLIAMIATGWALSWLIPVLWSWSLSAIGSSVAVPSRQLYSMAGEAAATSSVARLGLYELAWRAIEPSSLLTGFGYLGYYYLLEAGRGGIASYEQSITYFVHNDYVQSLLELGLPGLAGMIGITAWPLVSAWRAAPKIAAPASRLVLVALVASLGSMAAHAVVDFPFYVPVCLLIYGTALGVLDSILPVENPARPPQPDATPMRIRLRKMATAAAATLGVWVLAVPVAAEAAAEYAHRQWRAAHGEGAAYWFEVARRLQPRDWRYHWYAGQFWFAQAAQNRKREAARLADQAFGDGYAANAREVRNLLGRIATHRELGELLERPADRATLLSWADHAVKLAPYDPGVRTERVLVLKQVGAPSGETTK